MNEIPIVIARRPCSAAGGHPLPCPWRRDTAGTSPMPARLATEDFRVFCGTAERPAPMDSGMFVCHKSLPLEDGGRPILCAGWLAAVGRHHLGVRIAVAMGIIPGDALAPRPDGPPLFDTFDEMVAGHTFTDR